jgi:two-component system, chemotaxis family, chemotaxis protein CheY
MNALIVDDSRAIRSVLARMLTAMGFETCEAGHGREALERVRELPAPPKLILVDWNMPLMNGLELVTALRSDQANDKSSILMVTTEIELVHVGRALDAGANEYLMKPFTKESLVDKLKMMGMA